MMGRFLLFSCAILTLVVAFPAWRAKSPLPLVSAAVARESAPRPLQRVSEEKAVGLSNLEEANIGPRVHAGPRRLSAEPSDVTCPPPQGSENASTVDVWIGEYTLQATFACGETFNTSLLPQTSDSKKCLQQATDSTPKPIKDVLGVDGSFMELQPPAKKYTVTLGKMPSRQKVMYYKCNGTDPKVCTVTVKMPQAPATNVCTLDGAVELTVNAPGEAKFVCNGTAAQLDPPASENPTVYTGAACDGGREKLSTLLPGSTISGSDGTYTLNVASLPRVAKKLCFKCTHRNVPQPDSKPASDRMCTVLISVAADSSSPSSSSSTTTPQTAGSPSTVAAALLFGPAVGAVVGALAMK